MAGKTAEQEERREGHEVAFVVGALLGGVAGAAWTLFNVPRSGAETRAAIARSIGAMGHRVGAALDKAGETVRVTGEQIADRLALAIDSIAGGGTAEWPDPRRTVAAPAAPPASDETTATGPAVAVNGQAAAAGSSLDGETTRDVVETTGVAMTLDPSEVGRAPAVVPTGTTS